MDCTPTQDQPALTSWRGLLSIEPNQLERLMSMDPVCFIVGHERAGFSINPDLLSSLSAPLTALVTGERDGLAQGSIPCDDVSKDVFSRFVQFMYTGAYTSFRLAEKDRPDKRVKSVSGMTTNSQWDGLKDCPPGFTAFGEPQRINEGDISNHSFSLVSYRAAQRTGNVFGRPVSPFCNQHQPGPRRSSKRKLDSITCDCDSWEKKREFISGFMDKYGAANAGQIMSQSKPKSEPMPFELIGHARIWAFANKFAIASLMDLSSRQLAHELTQWTIRPSTFIADFGGLVRYVYGNYPGKGHQLKEVVAHFAACVVEDVSGFEGWSLLLKEIPDFAADLITQMSGRIG